MPPRDANFVWKHVAYALMMATRPQTLLGLADSPVGLASFLLDHDDEAVSPASRRSSTGRQGRDLTRDDILDNITLYWLTNTGVSSARLYCGEQAVVLRRQGRERPGRRERLPRRALQAPQSWAEQAYPNLIYYNKLDRGGHFAAWEQPKIFSEELRAAFRSLR